MVQGGTRWYKAVQGGMRNGTRRYKEVQGGTRIDQYVRAGTCWYVLILTALSGYAFLLDLLLQCCSAVLESSTSNHTNASSGMFQLSARLAALPSLGHFAGGGCRRRRFFRRRWRGRGVVLSGRLGSGGGRCGGGSGSGERLGTRVQSW
jgi:hypothetical protein